LPVGAGKAATAVLAPPLLRISAYGFEVDAMVVVFDVSVPPDVVDI
jgi:hypothetical protein